MTNGFTLAYFSVNRADLHYNPKIDVEHYEKKYSTGYADKMEAKRAEWEEERRARQEYWATVKYAKHMLYDYYGTACHFNPAAHGDLIRIRSMSPDEILYEASKIC